MTIRKSKKNEQFAKISSRITNISFEEGLKRLDDIVQAMEDSDLPLEDIMKSYEEGILLIRHCRERLDEAQSRIEVLEKEKNTRPGNNDSLHDEEETGGRSSKDGVRAKRVKVKEEEEDFIIDERLQGTLLDLEEKD